MIRRILFGAGALAWGSLCFLLGLYVTFPADAARDRVVYEFGKWSKDDYALDIGSLSPWRLSGVALEDVTLYSVKKGRRTKDDPDPPKERTPLLGLDGLSIRAAPISMLLGKKAMAFVAELHGGDIEGEFAQGGEVIELSFDADDVDLAKMPIETEQMTLNLLGVLSGESELNLDQADPKQSSGFLRIHFEGLGLGTESAVAGFTLPEVSFKQAGIAFEVKDGKLEVTEGLFESDTLNAELTGDIVLNKKLMRSRNRLELAFSLPEDLDKLAQIAPDLKRSRDDEGKYHMNIGGTLLSPSARFSKAGGRKIGKDVDVARPLDGIGSRLGNEDGESDEDRRAARKKRIEERRKRLQERREEAARNNPLNNDDEGPPMPEDDGEPGEDGPRRDGPRFPPDGQMDGPMMDGPMMDGPPMDEGMPPDFDPMDQ